jgi:hypothetical protein
MAEESGYKMSSFPEGGHGLVPYPASSGRVGIVAEEEAPSMR